jgi:hypothetical protein
LAIAFALALVTAASHQHTGDASREAQCAVCAIAHHSPTVTSAVAPVLAAVASAVAVVAPLDAPAARLQRSPECGRAPPASPVA